MHDSGCRRRPPLTYRPHNPRKVSTFGLSRGFEAGQLVANPVGVGVLEGIEDDKSLVPCIIGGRANAGAAVSVAEVDERGGFVVAVAKRAKGFQGLLIASTGLVVAAEV